MVSGRCARCGSDDLQGAKFGFGDVTLYELRCRNCKLSEHRRTSDPDFDEWLRRWQPDSDGDDDAASDVKAADDAETSIADKEQASAAVVAAPWDDAPRLAYAKAVEETRPERAELIRLQIERFARERAEGPRSGGRALARGSRSTGR